MCKAASPVVISFKQTISFHNVMQWTDDGVLSLSAYRVCVCVPERRDRLSGKALSTGLTTPLGLLQNFGRECALAEFRTRVAHRGWPSWSPKIRWNLVGFDFSAVVSFCHFHWFCLFFCFFVQGNVKKQPHTKKREKIHTCKQTKMHTLFCFVFVYVFFFVCFCWKSFSFLPDKIIITKNSCFKWLLYKDYSLTR